MKVPSGAYPYTDWPSYVNPALFSGVQFYRNPSWLVDVAAHTDGAGVIWNTATGYALRDETMTACQSASQSNKKITAAYLKSKLPMRTGSSPYQYWSQFTGKVAVSTATGSVPSAGIAKSPYLVYALVGVGILALIFILKRK